MADLIICSRLIESSGCIKRRKKTEEALLSSEKLFRILFENTQSFICTHKPNGELLSINKAAADIVGYNASEMIGQNLRVYFEPGKTLLFDQYLQTINTQGHDTGVFKIRNQFTGSEYYLLYQNIVYEEPGAERYIIGIAQDITDRVKAEKALIQAKEIAEKSVLIKEQFLTNISHEIRTPMNGIIGLSNVLSKMIQDPEMAGYIQAIQSSADKLLVIINDILDFSKIEAGHSEWEKTDFNIKNLLRETSNLFEGQASEKNNKLKVIIDADVPEVLNGDPGKLTQILNNLISNAIKFTHQGQIKLIVESLVSHTETETLEFVVQDTGIGIPADKLNTIFDSFTQATAGTSRQYGGTGLGLSICQSLLELQGSRISVTSQVNQGSTFRFQLTFRKVTGLPAPTVTAPILEPAALRPLKVLLAEDNQINQMLVRKVLSDWGFTLEVAANGLIAIEKYTENPYDLILMDMQMPEMDGYEATAYIRKLKGRQGEVPIIAFTAHASPGEADKCLRAGADAYVSKPFKPEELLAEIQGLLQHKNIPLLQPEVTALDSPPQTEPDAYNVNLDYLHELSGGDQDFMRELMTMFMDQMPENIANLQRYSQDKSFSDLKSLAHKMKSAVGLIGIPKLQELLSELQNISGQQTEIEKIPAMVAQVAAISEKALSELNILVKDLD